jgi:hypothetical protein
MTRRTLVVRHKDFGAPASNDEPITFTLYGETFRCAASIQGRTLLKFISVSSGDNPDEGATAILDFFDSALVKADRERFTELTTDDETVVPLETLASIMEWLVEQYSGRPTELPLPSESGEPTTGLMPVAVPSYPEPVSAS